MRFRCLRDVEAQARADGVVERLTLVQRDRGRGALPLNDRPVRRRRRIVEKGSILHQLGIQAAVVGVIDLLGHQSVEEPADVAGGGRRIDRDRWPRGAARRHGHVEQERYGQFSYHHGSRAARQNHVIASPARTTASG